MQAKHLTMSLSEGHKNDNEEFSQARLQYSNEKAIAQRKYGTPYLNLGIVARLTKLIQRR